LEDPFDGKPAADVADQRHPARPDSGAAEETEFSQADVATREADPMDVADQQRAVRVPADNEP
jgi:hypothetical protein